MSEEPLNLSERGAGGRESDRRLFMQFLALGGCGDARPVGEALASAGVRGVVYADAHDPFGVGLLAMSEDPGFFTGAWRELLHGPAFASLRLKPAYAMLGRSYTLGYESDLEETLLHRPARNALNGDWPWAVWYPLRRSGQFEQLDREQQMAILKEHGQIGFQYGRSGYAQDIRLACHGLDPHDNDFMVGLVGPELAPLSKLVQHMRQTQQTSLYLERLGPFFVGRVVWRGEF